MNKRHEFEQAVLGLADQLYTFALNLSRNPVAAEDLVQDTYVRAIRQQHQLRRPERLRPWLLTIMRNLFVNQYHRDGRDPVLVALRSGMTTDDLTMLSGGPTPEERLLSETLPEDLVRALVRLPETFRTVLFLCDVEDLSYREISRVMGCPLGTVRSRLARARATVFHELAASRGLRTGAQGTTS